MSKGSTDDTVPIPLFICPRSIIVTIIHWNICWSEVHCILEVSGDHCITDIWPGNYLPSSSLFSWFLHTLRDASSSHIRPLVSHPFFCFCAPISLSSHSQSNLKQYRLHRDSEPSIYFFLNTVRISEFILERIPASPIHGWIAILPIRQFFSISSSFENYSAISKGCHYQNDLFETAVCIHWIAC